VMEPSNDLIRVASSPSTRRRVRTARAARIFSAPAGTLSATTVTSDVNGNATVNYTTGSSPGTFTINAAVNAVNTQITVNVTSQ